jgi:putative hydrolase of the HAD superfamily
MSGDLFATGVQVIGFDGDDTLWHSEDAFARAQELLVDLLAAHAEAAEVLARLQEIEGRNRRLFGYGVKGFTLCMIETAIEVSGGEIPATDIERLIESGREMLERPVELLEGVAETLPLLAERYRLALITKGDLVNQESKITSSGLAGLFETIDVVSEKTSDSYLRILRRLRIEPEQFLMVGNSEVSDVWPVVALGAWSVLVPYPLTSLHESGLNFTESSPRLRTAKAISELPALLSGGQGPAASPRADHRDSSATP